MHDKHPRDVFLGGQAVLEGVMIRTRAAWAVAVRAPDGTIATTRGPAPTWAARLTRVPLARGVVALVETVVVGLRALSWSSAIDRRAASNPPKPWQVVLTTISVLGVFVLVFAVIPALAAGWLAATAPHLVRAAIEGTTRLGLFVGYIAAIGASAAIRRTFAYHGAEHMVIATYEAGEPLDSDHVRRHSRFHARCGTDFLLLVVLVSIVVFSFLQGGSIVARLAWRVGTLPAVAGIAYEVLRLSRRSPTSTFVRVLTAPGLFLQRLTTRPPTDDQVEVALAALAAVTMSDTV